MTALSSNLVVLADGMSKGKLERILLVVFRLVDKEWSGAFIIRDTWTMRVLSRKEETSWMFLT